ncbi:MAG: hypothetical protein J6M55_03810 [Paludibacteraceae bacterium]|nr:hypothetical protein [Paludibacteraceae bacterium]
MNDNIHAFPHTGTAYRSTIYTPFTLSVPSDGGMVSGGGSAGAGEGGNAAPQGAPHRAPVVFEEEGWTESADGLQSTKNNPLTATAPAGEPWVMLLLAIAYIFLRGKRLRTAAMVLLIAAIPAAATTVRLTIQNSAVRAGEKVIVAPTVTSAPEGKSFLCWELYHDEACTRPVERVTFSSEEAYYNKISFTAPAAGRYYLQTKMRSLVSCTGEVVASKKEALEVYPDGAAAVLVRSHQRAGVQIALEGEPEVPQTVYGVLQFDKETIHNEVLTASQRYNYFISFPFDVRVGDISGFGTYGRHWLIEYYDGLNRAQNGYWADSESNWKRITDTDSLLHAYQGYLLKLNSIRMAADKTDIWGEGVDHLTLYFPSHEPVLLTHANETIPALGESYRCTIDYSATLGAAGDRTIDDSYWRCIGVPGEAGYSPEGVAFVYQCHLNDSLEVLAVDKWTYEPTHAYLTQCEGAIVWRAPGTAGVPAKVRNANERSSIRIELRQEDKEKDRTFIRLSEDEKVTEGFEFGGDLAKEMNAGANIYTLIGTTRAAGNSLPESGQKVVVPIGVQVAEAGEYTFAMPESAAGRSVILADHSTGTRTDLALGSYTATVPQGCTDQRFSVEITPAPATPTAVGHLQGDEGQHTKTHKKIVDGALYIVHDGEVFDARGIRIRNGKWLR